MACILTIHAIERFAQRVLKREFAKEEKGDIESQLKDMYNEATYFWSGTYKDKKICDYYYHRDGYVFVVESDTIITIYGLDYGFGEEIDKQISESLAKQIAKMRKGMDKNGDARQRELAQKDQEIVQTEIRTAELNEQLKMVEARYSKLIAERDFILNELSAKQSEIDAAAMKLINSVQYRMDLLAAKKKGA